jgi:hypothetical protein
MTILSPVTPLDVPATPRYRRSLLRRVIEAVMEGRHRRKATAEFARYLRSHQQSLNPSVRAELERRLLGQ